MVLDEAPAPTTPRGYVGPKRVYTRILIVVMTLKMVAAPTSETSTTLLTSKRSSRHHTESYCPVQLPPSYPCVFAADFSAWLVT
jgi:hypothetical protein